MCLKSKEGRNEGGCRDGNRGWDIIDRQSSVIYNNGAFYRHMTKLKIER